MSPRSSPRRKWTRSWEGDFIPFRRPGTWIDIRCAVHWNGVERKGDCQRGKAIMAAGERLCLPSASAVQRDPGVTDCQTGVSFLPSCACCMNMG